MRTVTKALSAFVTGGALMYFYDRRSGRRRRRMLADQLVHARREVGQRFDVLSRDFRNRMHGMLVRTRALLVPNLVQPREDDDGILVERARAKLGHVCSHPRAIEVHARDGFIELKGDVLASERRGVVDAMAHVQGARGAKDELAPHVSAEGVPRLAGLREEDKNFRHGPLRHGLDIQRTLTVDAPIEQVFALWNTPEDFPRFMSHVRAVRRLDDDHYSWRVTGPLGVVVRWQSVITRREPHRLLAWKSPPGAIVSHAGTVRFEALSPAETRIHLCLTYKPFAGLFGHLVLALLGRDPKSEIDTDLVRFRSHVHGHDGAPTSP